MEDLQLVNPLTGDPTGEHLDRSLAISTGAWCSSTNVFVLDSNGAVLCHRRSLLKERHPGAWSTHLGGHVGAGETFVGNAAKELAEEANIVVPTRDLIPWRTTRLDSAKLWVREYVLLLDPTQHILVPQQGEVEEFAWMSPSDIFRRAKHEKWMAGTHDFKTEYACLRAVITAAHGLGDQRVPRSMLSWQPEFGV